MLIQKIDDCKHILQSGTDIELYDEVAVVRNIHVDSPSLPPLHTLTFNPVTDVHDKTREMIGTLVAGDESFSSSTRNGKTGKNNPRSWRIKCSSVLRYARGQRKSPLELSLFYPFVLSEFEYRGSVSTIQPTRDGNLWVSSLCPEC